MLRAGDLVLVDFPFTNGVGVKPRPAFVMEVYSDDEDVLLAYITSQKNVLPNKISYLSSSDLEEGHLSHKSIIRLDKTVLVHSSITKKIGRVNHSKMTEIYRKSTLCASERYCGINQQTKVFIPNQTAIPPSGKLIGVEEIGNMVNAALDGWLTTGRFNDAFEKKLADYLGVKYVLTVNSGSSANLVAFTALTSPKLGARAIKAGDEVITVAAGFPTTVNPIIQNGCVPVFVDVDIPTYNINVAQLELALSPKTRAVMLAHTLGNPFNLDVITAFCKKHNLWLIEDCCDALGSTYRGQKVGSFGDIATLSFYPAHHITMGEGGAVFTNNSMLKLVAESVRDWGRDCYCPPGKDNTCNKRFCWKNLGDLPEGYDHKYTYSHLGYNLKITDMQAACGLAQLDKLEGFIQKRQENFAYLKEKLKPLEKYLILPDATEHSVPSWFGFPITLRDNTSINRLQLLQHLDEHKIGTRLLFGGNLTRQPYMVDRKYQISGGLINTDKIMNNTFWIGVQPALQKEQLDFIVDKMLGYLK